MLALIAMVPLLLAVTAANAAGTRASTPINNTATVTYSDGGIGHAQQSNNNILRVDELLNVSIVSNDAGNVLVHSPDNARVLSFTVSNIGNGDEAFRLAANTAISGDQFDPQFQSLVLDSNNNGVYDPGTDTVYVPGSNDPVLAPDQSIRVFLVANIPASQPDGATGFAVLHAAALTGTGTGTPGSDFPGKGDNGVDAVLGTSGGQAQAQGRYQVSATTLTLVKTQSIAAPNGGSQPLAGAIVTYTLILQASGSGTAYNVAVNDPIPAGVSYIAGSLRLDGAVLSDAADADAGQFSGNAVSVQLGQVQAPSTHTIVFQVTVN